RAATEAFDAETLPAPRRRRAADGVAERRSFLGGERVHTRTPTRVARPGGRGTLPRSFGAATRSRGTSASPRAPILTRRARRPYVLPSGTAHSTFRLASDGVRRARASRTRRGAVARTLLLARHDD